MRKITRIVRDFFADNSPYLDNDHRERGEYASRYPASVWVQVVAELVVLIGALGFSVYALAFTIWAQSHKPSGPLEAALHGCMPWTAVFFAGVAGGCLFALKFLYHTVAKEEWNRDRVLWRFIVPLNSGTLAVCSGFGISAGVIPFLDAEAFENIYAAMFFGFFIGHFSDNFLAALQRLALDWFGTVDRVEKK